MAMAETVIIINASIITRVVLVMMLMGMRMCMLIVKPFTLV
jgi:hypothetical protein